jgi:hypothetical protein
MSDQDLRALAAKLLKHYAADKQLGAVVDEIVANTELDRGEEVDDLEISAEERNLLNLLGGYMAEANERQPLALTAQGCGDGGGDGGDGGGDGGGGGGDDDGDDDGADGADGDDDEGDDESEDDGPDPDAPDPNANPISGPLSAEMQAALDAKGITGSVTADNSAYGDLSGVNAGNFGASQNAGAFGLSGPNDASGYAGSYGGPQGSYGDLSGISAAGFGGLSAGMNATGPEAATATNEAETQGNPYGDLSGVLGFAPSQSIGPAGAFGTSGPADASGYAGNIGTATGGAQMASGTGAIGGYGDMAGSATGAYGGTYGGSQTAGTSSGQTAGGGPTASSSTSYDNTVAPIASSTTATQSPSFLSDPLGWASAKASNIAENAPSYAVNAAMMGVPVVGTVNTLSGLLGGPTIGGMMQAGTPAGPADMSADLGGGGSSTVPRQNSGGGSGGVAAASPVVAAPAMPALATLVPPSSRKFLGLPADPYRYGFGAERTFFAEGGPVTAPNPPTQTMLSPMPTMAYTDGQGSVGAVAAPPAMSGYDMVGSDAPHASPTAPAPAAAAPSFAPPPLRAATFNANAAPVAAPISQNPNMGYSLGMPPLTGLRG